MIGFFVILACEDSTKLFSRFSGAIFEFYADMYALKMRRMQKLVNYADPHHRIPSDSLN